MKFCVFGAGAIGGDVAAHLARVDGVDVSVVARGDHLAAIKDKGLRLEPPKGFIASPVRATDRPADLGPQDVVFVALKSGGLRAWRDPIFARSLDNRSPADDRHSVLVLSWA